MPTEYNNRAALPGRMSSCIGVPSNNAAALQGTDAHAHAEPDSVGSFFRSDAGRPVAGGPAEIHSRAGAVSCRSGAAPVVEPAGPVRSEHGGHPVGGAGGLEFHHRRVLRAGRRRAVAADGAADHPAGRRGAAGLGPDQDRREGLLRLDAGAGIRHARRVHGPGLVAVLHVLGIDPDPAVFPDRPVGRRKSGTSPASVSCCTPWAGRSSS